MQLHKLASNSTPSPAPVVYAVPQPSLRTDSLPGSSDNVPISGQCIVSILHASETGGPVIPISQESNSFNDCGVSPSIISTTTTGTGSTSILTTTSTLNSSTSSLSTSAPSSSATASIVSPTSSVTTSAPSGSNAGSSLQPFAVSVAIFSCILAFTLQLL